MLRWLVFLVAVTSTWGQQTSPVICRNNLVMVVDKSGSIVVDGVGKIENWYAVQNFLERLILDLNIGPEQTEVGLVTFSNGADLEWGIGTLSQRNMASRARSLVYSMAGGRTNTNAGLELAENMLRGYTRQAQDLVLLMTDGNATASLNTELSRTVQRMKAAGIRVIGLGITDAVSDDEIKTIVSNPASDYFAITNFEDLESRLLDILDQVCVNLTCNGNQVYSTCYFENCERTCEVLNPTNPPCERRTCLSGCTCPEDRPITRPDNQCIREQECPDIDDCQGDLIYDPCVRDSCQATCSNLDPDCGNVCAPGCRCPNNNPVLLPNGRCGTQALCSGPCVIDLILVVDESGSIWKDVPDGTNYWLVMREFLIQLVRSLQIGMPYTRVGMVMFGDDAREIFRLNTHYDKEQIINEINAIQCRCEFGGFTNTTGALRLMRQNLFTQASGDRPDAQNVVLLITDGNDNRENGSLMGEVQAIKNLGARFVTVGLTREIDEDELRMIASLPNDFIFVSQFSQLISIFDELLERTCRNDTSCPPPTPINEVAAFSAYITSDTISVSTNHTVIFDSTWTNINNHYNTRTGIFTCPCKGLYLFFHEWSAIDHGLGTGIMHNGLLKSPVAQVNAHGAMSTTTVFVCEKGGQVYVEVLAMVHGRGLIICSHAQRSTSGFGGSLLHALA